MGDNIYSDGFEDDDKRSMKRRHLIYYLCVYDRNSGNQIGHVVDVTPDGIMTISDSPIEIDKEFQFLMDLPSEMLGKTNISFDARSLWSSRDANPDFFNTGFEIIEMDWQGRKLIERLISSYGFND